MAEERLMDLDKDKKYRIRINEDGEEELYLANEEEAEEEEVQFDFPNYDSDDEELAGMTPEQVEHYQKEREAEKLRQQEKVEKLLAESDECLQKGEYPSALHLLEQAEKVQPSAKCYAMQIRAYTYDFSNYKHVEKSVELLEELQDLEGAQEQKNALYGLGKEKLEQKIAEFQAVRDDLHTRNEEARAKRMVVFKQVHKKNSIVFFTNLAIFMAFLVATLCLMPIMFSDPEGVLFVVTLVLGGLALVSLLVLIFTARHFVDSAKNISRNKKNTTSKLGRAYLEAEAQLKNTKALYKGITPNDLS